MFTHPLHTACRAEPPQGHKGLPHLVGAVGVGEVEPTPPQVADSCRPPCRLPLAPQAGRPMPGAMHSRNALGAQEPGWAITPPRTDH